MGNTDRDNRWKAILNAAMTHEPDHAPVMTVLHGRAAARTSDKIPEAAAIRIFPNPCRDGLTIDFVPESQSFKLNDALGNTVYRAELKRGVNQLSVGHLRPGVYFAHIGTFPAKILVIQPD